MNASKLKIISRGALCAVLVAAMLLSPGCASVSVSEVSSVTSSGNIKDSNIQNIESQIASLQSQQNALKQQIAAVRNEASAASEYKQYMDSLVSATQQKIVLSETLIKQLETKIADSETQIADTEQAIEDTYERLKERLRYSQENGTVSEIELLLDARGLSDFLTRLDKVGSMMDYDTRVMDEYEETKKKLDEYKASLETSKATQEQVLEDLEADKANFQAISDENAQYMQSLMNDAAAFEAKYAQMKAAEENLNAELEAYIKKMQEQSQVVPSGKGFICPLPAGVFYISSHFGWRNLFGKQDNHYGTDLPCATGTSIFAADSGKVLKAEWHYSYGNYVIIDHGNGLSTLYAHCSALAVSAGQNVERGQVIGYVGETGNAYGAHLHLEVRVNGVRADAEQYIPLHTR